MNTNKEGIRETVQRWTGILGGEDLQRSAPILKIVSVINDMFPFDDYLVSWDFNITPGKNPYFALYFLCEGERYIQFFIRKSVFAVNFSGLYGYEYYITMNYSRLLQHLEFWSEKARQRVIQKEEGWTEDVNGWKTFVDFNMSIINASLNGIV